MSKSNDQKLIEAMQARLRLEGDGLPGFIRQQPLLALFHAVATPKEFFIDSPKDYYQTKRTIKLLENASKLNP